jgi:hypothetical protein
MEWDLFTAKQAVKDLFPQLRNKNFILWKPQGIIGNVFKIQEYVINGKEKELFGNEYYVDLDLKEIYL